tara:strand:+ start:445 stop:615 length:171 start_codon:yes stop_codon:yes gene_type:complete
MAKSSKIVRAALERKVIDLQEEVERYKKAYDALQRHLEAIDLENFKKELKNQVRHE